MNATAHHAARIAPVTGVWLALNALLIGWIAFAISPSAWSAEPTWAPFQGYRIASVSPQPSTRSGFTTLTPAQTGVVFTNRLSEDRALANQILLNGSGVAIGDLDGDGLSDLYFCGLDSPNALYRNVGGWKFTDITAGSGAECVGQSSTGVAMADIDGDGDLDLLVNGLGRGTRLFLNDGRARFKEVTRESGLASTAGSMSLALADIEGDGDLDLYVVNYRVTTMRDEPEKRFKIGVTNGVYRLLAVDDRPATDPGIAGRYVVSAASGVLENGEPDQLWLNDGQGHFTPVRWDSGRFLTETGQIPTFPLDWGLSAHFRDLNGDGAPDLYVCNDFQSPDRLWINDGKGNFKAIATRAVRQTSLFSMGMDGADIDRDGFVDFFVADMLSRDFRRRHVQVMDASGVAAADPGSADRPQFSRNTLFRNRGDGTFAEIARFAGVAASEWSWCPVFLDVDLDGYEDLLITTGHARDAQNADIAAEIETDKRSRKRSFIDELRLRRKFPVLDTPNVAFRNRGDRTFEEVGSAWGFDSKRVSHGIALADLDTDGDLDAVVTCLNDGPLLLRNDTAQPRVQVRLTGAQGNTHGVGAQIRVVAKGLPLQTQEIVSAGRYLACDDAIRTFAVPTGGIESLDITWRSGQRTHLSQIPANSILQISESGPTNTSAPAAEITRSKPEPFFTDLSDRLKHLHGEEAYDDFARQRLLPRRLSQMGPGISCFDFNGDGWADLLIGTGRGGKIAVFRNDTQGGFVPQRAGALQGPAPDDLTTLLGWKPSSAEASLLIGLSNYERGRSNSPAVRQFHLMTGADLELPNSGGSATGPMAMADIDGDGDLDLFVGGRVVPGRYPAPASSQLLLNTNGTFTPDPVRNPILANAGLASGAVFTDLDLDGTPELIVANEWGPIRIYRTTGGRLVPWDPPITTAASSNQPMKTSPLSTFTGWWTSVAAGDVDGDGTMDLVAGNWGLNVQERGDTTHPWRLHYGDADGDGTLDLIESVVDPARGIEMPVRDWKTLSASFASLGERFGSFTAFSKASMADVLKAGLPEMHSVNATEFEPLLLLNRTHHFEARRLPFEARISPVFGIAVGDLDGDGKQDVFLAQNFFGVSSADSRQDASEGCWLKGDGAGGFKGMTSTDSGIVVDGEARGAALADFNHDGRLDLVITQNRGPTRLFQNRSAQPGLRLRLQGKENNPEAIGASVRGVYRDGTLGPRQEIHCGGGFQSQDATELVLSRPQDLVAVEIHWPGGRRSRMEIRGNPREMTITEPAAP